jgi:hypothetical protein
MSKFLLTMSIFDYVFNIHYYFERTAIRTRKNNKIDKFRVKRELWSSNIIRNDTNIF